MWRLVIWIRKLDHQRQLVAPPTSTAFLFVILISSIICWQLQQKMAGAQYRDRMDLAQATARHAPQWLLYSLWVILN